MSKIIYIVYETPNLVNGKFYIGVHKINGSNYLGSGKILKQAIDKYGKDKFMRETLREFDNEQDAYEYERLIVNKEITNNTNCYNIMSGGYGSISGEKHPCYGTNRQGKNNPMYGKHHSKETLKRISESQKGKIVTEEHKKNMSIGRKGKMVGKSHPKSKKWFINGKLFHSSHEAGKFFNITNQTIINWCRSNVPLCYTINKGKQL